ncbi:MAG: nucleoside triphosphate pyrophosphohydrolase [Clostridiaceae bacterium]|jgi:tetrapyrrole methylase family protein/MazG family protein|nr:nucleoside triphosphate pyrophosphohydrolase [Clostridiaceae bacterium]
MDVRSEYAKLRERYTIEDLVAIMDFLRSPDGCPWDREQTHASLAGNMLEEAYEVVDAIGSGRPERLCDELGDVMMQVVFHADLARAEGTFGFEDVVTGICRKLVSRHTHVFGADEAQTASDVVDTWERNKRKEKGLRTTSASMREVTRSLPALTRSEKVQKRAAKVGFDWAEAAGAADKIVEELAEVREVACQAIQDVDHARRLEEEIGDLLFSVVNYARKLEVEPELALDRACEKFILRFTDMEAAIRAEGGELESMSLEEMDVWWERVKSARTPGGIQ